MAFPFIIKYKKSLDHRFDSLSNENILNCIQEILETDRVDRIYIENNTTLSYENDYFFSKRMFMFWNIWDLIFSGQIMILENHDKREIIYQINTTGAFIFGALMGTMFFIVTKMIIVGLIAISPSLLIWLYLILMHRINFSAILSETLKKCPTG